jgi:hypothetical protein
MQFVSDPDEIVAIVKRAHAGQQAEGEEIERRRAS